MGATQEMLPSWRAERILLRDQEWQDSSGRTAQRGVGELIELSGFGIYNDNCSTGLLCQRGQVRRRAHQGRRAHHQHAVATGRNGLRALPLRTGQRLSEPDDVWPRRGTTVGTDGRPPRVATFQFARVALPPTLDKASRAHEVPVQFNDLAGAGPTMQVIDVLRNDLCGTIAIQARDGTVRNVGLRLQERAAPGCVPVPDTLWVRGKRLGSSKTLGPKMAP